MELLQQNPWLVPLVGIVALVAVGATLLLVAAVMVASKTAQAEEKTVHDVALEVLAGMWGNGEGQEAASHRCRLRPGRSADRSK